MTLERLPTGIPGLDNITHGGLIQGGDLFFHNIIFVHQVEKNAALTLLIGILKTRDSSHDSRLWELEIESLGARVVRPFAPTDHGLMRGGDAADA